jgi:hypothetical protein
MLNVRSLIVHICRDSSLFLKKYMPIARMGIKKVSILLLVLLCLLTTDWSYLKLAHLTRGSTDDSREEGVGLEMGRELLYLSKRS